MLLDNTKTYTIIYLTHEKQTLLSGAHGGTYALCGGRSTEFSTHKRGGISRIKVSM